MAGLFDALKQYWQDASPGGALNPELPVDTPVLGLFADPVGSVQRTVERAKNDIGAFNALRDKAYGDSKNPLRVTDQDSANQYNELLARGLLNFGAVGVIDPVSKARFINDLTTGKPSGEYVLGTINDHQNKLATALTGTPGESNNVMMTNPILRKLYRDRIQKDGLAPEFIGKVAEQALEPRSDVQVLQANSNQHPNLIQRGLLDSGQRYDALMAIDGNQSGDAWNAITVYPRGISGKTKPPRR